MANCDNNCLDGRFGIGMGFTGSCKCNLVADFLGIRREVGFRRFLRNDFDLFSVR